MDALARPSLIVHLPLEKTYPLSIEPASFFRPSRFCDLEAGVYENDDKTKFHAAIQGRGGSVGVARGIVGTPGG